MRGLRGTHIQAHRAVIFALAQLSCWRYSRSCCEAARNCAEKGPFHIFGPPNFRGGCSNFWSYVTNLQYGQQLTKFTTVYTQRGSRAHGETASSEHMLWRRSCSMS